MIKKKIEKTSAVILICGALGLAGCTKVSETEVIKTENTNQPVVLTNANTAVNMPPVDSIAATNSAAVAPVGNSPGAISPPVESAADKTAANVNLTAKDKKTAPPAPLPTPQIGTGGEDMLTFIQARNALSSDKDLIDAVIIDIKGGNAILTGKVASPALKQKAEQLVKGVQGVKSVKNNLSVAP